MCRVRETRPSCAAGYDESGEQLMHVQRAVDDFDVFARSLSIGAETMVMWFDPDKPIHDRYQVRHDFLPPDQGQEVVTISKIVNAFFRWEFNSCESIVRGSEVHPIDYANATPDVALTSLHYYFPWAITALVRWSAFCLAEGRRMHIDVDARPWFEIGDDDSRTYEEKLVDYRRLADAHFQAEEYAEFCDTALPHLDELGTRVVHRRRVRPAARRHRAHDVPGTRARAVRRALPRPDRRVVARPPGLTQRSTGARTRPRSSAPFS